MALSKSLLILTICGVLASGAFGRQLLQSTSTNNQTVRWYVPGNGNLGSVNVPVGGSVTFSWTSLHDLWEIPSLTCPATFANGSGITQISPQVNGGSRTINYTSAGTRYYACSVSTHCREGQVIAIRVGATSPAPAPGPSSRYGSGYGGGAGCGGNSTSGSGYGGSSGSGSNYAGAPGTSAYGGGSSNSTGSNSTSSYGGGSAGYAGGGAGYAGGSSSNYASGSG